VELSIWCVCVLRYGVSVLGSHWRKSNRLELGATDSTWPQHTFPAILIGHGVIQVHALTPLSLVMPYCRVISKPTVLLGALWMPYSRDLDLLRATMAQLTAKDTPPPASTLNGPHSTCLTPTSRLGQDTWPDPTHRPDATHNLARHEQRVSEQQVSAIFCHVDVIGADMSGGVFAERGLAVNDFPAHLPVYTGHYHNPHSLWGQEGSRLHPITYVGSQWQTSMSEAHELKRLLLLDSEKAWSVVEDIPIAIGRRHFRATSLSHLRDNLADWKPRKGDRVQVRVESGMSSLLPPLIHTHRI